MTPSQRKLVEAAAGVTVPGSAGLSDIRHVVILMQENRSFDHYFGTMSAVRGFSDPHVLTRDVGGCGTRYSTSSATSRGPAPTRTATCSRSTWSVIRR